MKSLPSCLPYADRPILIEEGAVKKIGQIAEQLGLKGRGVAVYDDLTMLTLKDKPQVFRSIPFDNEQLYCNDRALFYLRMQFAREGDYLIAIGGETVQALTKIVAAECHIPYIAVPTCAYGMNMATSAADLDTAQGYQQGKGSLPAAIIADTALMAQAPQSITLGAVRDLIDRAGFLARSRAQALAAGYAWNQALMDCQTQAIDAALRQCNTSLRRNDPAAYAKLCQALILCGLAQEQQRETSRYPHRLQFLNERTLRTMPDCE